MGGETAGSGRVSGAVAHLSKSRRAARQRDAIADRMLGMGDHGRREATSDRLIASAERPVTIIPLTIGLSVTSKKPVSANCLPVPKNKRF